MRPLVLALALAFVPLSVAPADSLRPVEPIDREVDPAPGTWLRVFYHAHSTMGGWSYRAGRSEDADRAIEGSEIPKWLGKGREAGLDAMIFTEHNTIAHFGRFRERETDLGRESILLYGIEYSGERGNGHLGLVYLPRDDDDAIRPRRTDEVPIDEYRAAIEAVHARGGLAVVNHATSGTFPWPDESTLGADAVEVFTPAPMSLPRTLRWWQERLRIERRPIFPIAGGDFHPVPVLSPALFRGFVNLVRVEEVSAEGVLAGLVAGRVVAIRHWPWRTPDDLPAVEIAAGADLSARIGDEVRLDGDSVRFQIRVTNGDGWRVRIFDETEDDLLREYEVSGDDHLRAYEKDVPGDWGFVRVELYRPIGFERIATGLVSFRRPGR